MTKDKREKSTQWTDYTDVLRSEISTADRHYKNPHTGDEKHSYLCIYVGYMSSV